MYIFIYRLWLRNNTVYIGMTNNPQRRLKDHKSGRGSIHTMGEPIAGMDIIWKGPVVNKYHGKLTENSMARREKQQYPERNVYGGELSERYKKICIKKMMYSK